MEAEADTLSVFVIHDDPTLCADDEERWWAAIAAENEQQAVAIAAATYSGNGSVGQDGDWRNFFAVVKAIDCSTWPERIRPRHPEQLRDCESLRLCWFREYGEQFCESCGMAAMGMRDHVVCDECCRCAECGCACE